MLDALYNSAILTNTDVVVDTSGNVQRGADSVIVDDTDTAIFYGKGWQIDNGALTSNIHPLMPFNSTLHAAFESTDLLYNFTGSYVEAWVAGPNIFECFLDGVKMNSSSTTSSLQTITSIPSLSPACAIKTTPKQHTLQITVNGTANNPFWIDFIRYVPINSTDLRPARVVSVREFSLTTMRRHELLSQQWDNQGSYIFSTLPGASLIFNFTGASVAGLGIYDNKFAHNSSVGSYAVDNQAPMFFLIENLSSNELSSLYNQVLFQTPQYPLGLHQIEIIYYGNAETAPLLMMSLLVHNQTMNLNKISLSNSNPPNMSISSIPAPTIVPSSSSGKQSINNAARIIYGICGTLLGVLALIGFFILYNRRRRRLGDSTANRAVSPFPALAEPPFIPSSKQMRQLCPESDPVIPPISPPSLPNPLRKIRGLFSAPIFPSMVRSQQAHIAQMNTNQNSGDLRHFPSIRLLVHEDSGVRLERPIENQTTVVEVPPTYTPL